MIKPIVKDVMFLGQVSEPSTKEDVQIARDLRDTLAAHCDGCVGMAANMIVYKKCTIIVSVGLGDLVMHNLVIVSKSGEYETEEGCLSLIGVRKTKRYKEIEVVYRDEDFVEHRQKFSGYVAQIVQHEVDHLSGKII